MSVRTTADEKLESARDHIQAARVDLAEIVVRKCWGHDEYSDKFIDKLRRAFFVLIELDI